MYSRWSCVTVLGVENDAGFGIVKRTSYIDCIRIVDLHVSTSMDQPLCMTAVWFSVDNVWALRRRVVLKRMRSRR